MVKRTSIFDLLAKPLWQLTGEEYVELHAYAVNVTKEEGHDSTTKTTTRCTGVRELAQFLQCSESQIYALKRNGILDDATMSSIGKSTVFDGEKARELAQAFMDGNRKLKANKQ